MPTTFNMFNMYNTFTLLKRLFRRSNTDHPLYRHDVRLRPASPTWRRILGLRRRVSMQIALAAIFSVLFLGTAFLCGSQGNVLEIAMSCIMGGGIAIPAVIFVLLPYLWPVFLSGSVSSVIVTERARQTWDTLLTLPFDHADLLTVKAAAALRNLEGLIPLWLWSQVILAVAFLAGQDLRGWGGIVLLAAMLEFAVARFQDYVLACVIGLNVSLRVSSREAAGPIAVMAALSLVIVRLVFTLPFLAHLPATLTISPALLLLIVATGPSSAITLALPNGVGIVILALMIVLREAAIQLGFRYLVDNLGVVAAN